MTRGLVFAEPGAAPVVEEITLDAPGPREVQIRVEAFRLPLVPLEEQLRRAAS